MSASHQNQPNMGMFAEACFSQQEGGRRSLGVGIKIGSTTQATAKNNFEIDILKKGLDTELKILTTPISISEAWALTTIYDHQK